MNRPKGLVEEIKLYQSQDFEIDKETDTYVEMKKNTGSVIVHLLLALFFWWTLFIPNIVYYFSSVKKHKIMK